MSRPLSAALLGVLILAAGTELLYRGVGRSFNDSRDLIIPYLSSRAWLQGLNPYDPGVLSGLWATAAPERAAYLDADLPPVYPPSTFPLIAALAWLPWSAAHVLFLFVSLAAVACAVAGLTNVAGLPLRSWRGALVVGMSLALAPLQTGLAKGNLGITSGALALASIWVADRRWDKTAGVLLGLALSMKPLVAAAVFAFYVLVRRPLVWSMALAIFAGLTVVPAISMSVHGHKWLTLWAASVRASAAPGAINDPTPANPYRYHLINLAMPLVEILRHPAAATALALSIVALAALALRPFAQPVSVKRDSVLLLAALSVLSLLPVYHRAYDAVIILPALIVAVTALGGPDGRRAGVILLCCAVFFFPGASLLAVLAGQGFVPETVQTTWFWQVVLIPHQVWTLCVLAVLLIAARRRSIAPALA